MSFLLYIINNYYTSTIYGKMFMCLDDILLITTYHFLL